MLPLWHLFIELTVCPDDFPGGGTIGFMNVLLRAETAEEAEQKLKTDFEQFKWSVVTIENARRVPIDFVADDDEFADLVERAHAHPDPILLGTFNSYKAN